jgi:outer membrane protein OmpA-like peptidoglycan-associated protein
MVFLDSRITTMSDQNDDAQNYALMVLAGVVVLVLAGVLALAIAKSRTSAGSPAAAATAAVPAGRAAAPAVPAKSAESAERLYFDLGSDALPADATSALARVADLARANGGLSVLISGFHDASGDPVKNADLAKRRAQAVRHALEANGVAPDRLVMSKPELTTGGADPREARRVELRLR